MASEWSGFPQLLIEPMGDHDLREVIAIEEESFPVAGSLSLWQRELASGMARNLMARIRHGDREEAAGFLNCWIVAGELQLNTIAVRKGWRRLGIAARLMAAMMRLAAAEGLESATLEVRSSNQAAIKLYEKFNFVLKGTRKRYYDDTGEDALIMWARIEK